MLDLVLCIRNRIYREGLQRLLQDRPEFRRVRTCWSIEGLERLLAQHATGAILFDVRAATHSTGAELVRAAFHSARGCPVIVMGLDGSEAEFLASLEAGAAACVSSEDSISRLVSVIRAAAKGELVCPPRLGRLLQTRLVGLSESRAGAHRLERLSRREHHVLSLLEDRLSNKQIARRLGLEVSTIKNHVHNIIVKLAVSSRAEAAAVKRSASRPWSGTVQIVHRDA